MLYEYLKGNYEPGEPIFSGDISIAGLSEELDYDKELAEAREKKYGYID